MKSTSTRTILGYIFAAMTLGLLAYGAAYFQPSLSRAITLATTHQPEQFTELYFNDVPHLPAGLAAGSSAIVSFRLVNHEAQNTSYQYEVTEQIGSVITTVATGQVSLMPNAAANIPVTVSAPISGQTALVTVRLVGRAQTLQLRIAS